MGQFRFKKFSVDDSHCAMKIGTDGVLLGAWADVETSRSILDVGCGSGLISLMMAQRNPDAEIVGVEIDEHACGDALANVRRSEWSDRIRVVNMDILDYVEMLESPLTILSNPPFYTEDIHSPDCMRTLARHGAKFGVRELIEFGAGRLSSPADSLAFIAPAGRDEEIEFLLELKRLEVRRHTVVFYKKGKMPFRSLWQVGKTNGNGCSHEISYLCIRNEDNSFSEEYAALTSAFYLDK